MRTDNHVQLSVYECPYQGGPTALVRYTSYGEDGKAEQVQQVTYGIEARDLLNFDMDTTTALEMGVDVTIFTRVDVELFPELSKYCAM